MGTGRSVLVHIIERWRNSDHRLNDLILAIVSFSLLIAMSLMIRPREAPEWEAITFEVINDLPNFVYYIIWPFMQYGVFITIPVVAAIALYFKKVRLALLLLWGGIGIYYAARIFKSEFPRERPAQILHNVTTREYFAPWSKGFTSGHTAVAATIATFSHYYLRYRWQVLSILTLIIVVIGRIYVGAHLPLDVFGGVALGVGVASLINFIVGVPKSTSTAIENTRELIKLHRPRHPGDIIRLVIAAVAFALTTVLALTGSVSNLEEAFFRTINYLPSILSPLFQIIMQFGALFFVFVAGLVTLSKKHNRLAIKIVTGGTGVWLLAKIAKALVLRDRPFFLLENILTRAGGDSGMGFPSGHASVAALIATVASPYVSKNWSRVLWGFAWMTAIARMFVGVHLPLDVFAGLSIGWFFGSLLNLAFGTPAKPLPKSAIKQSLKDAGMEPQNLEEAAVDARGSIPLYVQTKSGQNVFIKVIDSEHRSADILYRIWRFITLRGVQDEVPFATAKHLAEHEAYITIQADHAGVRVPKVLLSTAATKSASIIVTKRITGHVVPEYSGTIDGVLLERIWTEVAKLHKNRITHRDLRAHNIMIDSRRRPWLIDFSFSQTAATDLQINKDLVELMVSLSLYSSIEQVVEAAIKVLGPQTIISILPYFQPAAVSRDTRHQLHHHPELMSQIENELYHRTNARRTVKVNLWRFDLRWVLFTIVLFTSAVAIVSGANQISEVSLEFQSNDIPLLGGVLAASLFTYLFSAQALRGAALKRLPLGNTLLVQFATSAVNRITPKGIGGVILLEQFLEHHRHNRAQATASVSIMYAAGALVHIVLTIIAVLLINPDFFDDLFTIRLSEQGILIGSITILLAYSSYRLIPQLKIFISHWTKATSNMFKTTIKSKHRILRLFGGSIGITFAYIVAFWLSINAFGPNIDLLNSALVYLTANIIAAAAPTPGGLGAAEASLSVGLGFFDIPLTQAVTAVLVFRLLTFWLPIIPGIFAMQYLRKHKSV